MKTLAYHGTYAWDQVLREGLRADKAPNCKHIWLARTPEDAAHFGTVLVVDMTGIEGGFEDGPKGWQGCYHGGNLEVERISLYKKIVLDTKEGVNAKVS